MNKRALVLGLGLLGGGVAITNWLLKHGYKVAVTDLKSRVELLPSLKKIRGKVDLILGKHQQQDIRAADLIVLNQDISVKNDFVRYARKIGKAVENEGRLFYNLFDRKIIAVTGTRGKTTTVNWLDHFLKAKFRSTTVGNAGDKNPFLEVADRRSSLDIAVAEMPSYQLEFFADMRRSPDIAVVTNIYQDHLNRHSSMTKYALVKANIFKNQTSGQHLILNFDNKWTQFLLKQKPKSEVWLLSLKKLPIGTRGLFHRKGKLCLWDSGKTRAVLTVGDFVNDYGRHNLENLLASSLAAYLAGCSWPQIQQRVKSLPKIPFRQEIVFENRRLKIINDTTATSPDGGIAAIKRFGSPSTILIAGGTDRRLDYRNWVGAVAEHIRSENLVLLAGSATKKMSRALGKKGKKFAGVVCGNLQNCLKVALTKAAEYNRSLVLFSPAAKSFEKFKNEFDRGKQFNFLVRRMLNERKTRSSL